MCYREHVVRITYFLITQVIMYTRDTPSFRSKRHPFNKRWISAKKLHSWNKVSHATCLFLCGFGNSCSWLKNITQLWRKYCCFKIFDIIDYRKPKLRWCNGQQDTQVNYYKRFGFALVLWHIKQCRLFNANSIFIDINSPISNIYIYIYVRKSQNRRLSVLARDSVVQKKYDELKLVNYVQRNEIQLIEKFTYLVFVQKSLVEFKYRIWR